MANPQTITEADQWTDPVQVTADTFDVSIYGASGWTGTLTLQRRRVGSGSSGWRDITTYSGAAEEVGEVSGNWDVRLGVKSGASVVGSIIAEVSK